jgi:hypothetical protein
MINDLTKNDPYRDAESADAATVQNLKIIAAAQIQYYNTHSRTFGTFDQLVKEQMLNSKFSGDQPMVNGYILTLKVTPKTASALTSYSLNAAPQNSDAGNSHFYLDDSTDGNIHVNPDQEAGPNDPLWSCESSGNVTRVN